VWFQEISRALPPAHRSLSGFECYYPPEIPVYLPDYHSKIMPFETAYPLEISNDHPWGSFKVWMAGPHILPFFIDLCHAVAMLSPRRI